MLGAAENPEQQAIYGVMLGMVEAAVSDQHVLIRLEDKVRAANLDPDDRKDLLGRIGTYMADFEKAKLDGGDLPF